MESTMALILDLIKKLLLIIFEKYGVAEEFDALGVDVVGFLSGTSEPVTEEAP